MSTIALQDRLIVALDVPTVENAERLVGALGDSVTFYKIGLQLIFAGGVKLAADLAARGKKVFLDAKLLDIDQTVKSATENIAKMGVTFLTVHADAPAIRAAVEGRGKSGLKILGVTVLTSRDERDLNDMGVAMSVPDYVMKRVAQAQGAGADGVIASGLEAKAIRAQVGGAFTIVTPGIRLEGGSHDDQKRVATPFDAISAGADYIVVGREILRAENPGARAEAIVREIERGLR